VNSADPERNNITNCLSRVNPRQHFYDNLYFLTGKIWKNLDFDTLNTLPLPRLYNKRIK
jgi:hypothetical protein